jgi:hypothetical protein
MLDMEQGQNRGERRETAALTLDNGPGRSRVRFRRGLQLSGQHDTKPARIGWRIAIPGLE